MRTLPNERLTAETSAGSPERKCILSGEHGAREGFIRLALSPDGQVLPDVRARAPGRGAWIGVSRADLENALQKGKLRGALMRAFGKALGGTTLSIPDDLPERIDNALVRLFCDRLGLELKSGKLILGSDRIAEQARMGRVSWLAHASDASEDGSRKLDQAWRVGREEEGSGRTGVTLPLDRAALSVALGRDNVVHLALTDPDAAQRVSVPLRLLLHFRGQAESNGMNECTRSVPGAQPLAATIPDQGRALAN